MEAAIELCSPSDGKSYFICPICDTRLRITPQCPNYYHRCSGCDFEHVDTDTCANCGAEITRDRKGTCL